MNTYRGKKSVVPWPVSTLLYLDSEHLLVFLQRIPRTGIAESRVGILYMLAGVDRLYTWVSVHITVSNIKFRYRTQAKKKKSPVQPRGQFLNS